LSTRDATDREQVREAHDRHRCTPLDSPGRILVDGWWIEEHVEGVTGWAIGDNRPESRTSEEIDSLYTQLERSIVPLYYQHPERLADIGRSAIAINGSFFNAQRMLSQYILNAYEAVAPAHRREERPIRPATQYQVGG
jgi:glucan phosphorylase